MNNITNSDDHREFLKEELGRVHVKLDKIAEDISDIKVQDAIQNDHLAVHIKRTNLLEERINPIEKLVTSIKAILALITFLLTIPHIERLAKWLFSSFF